MQFIKQEHKNKYFPKIALGIFGVALVSFVGVKLYPYIHGPDIQVTTINNGAHLTEPVLAISGQARFTKDLIVNGAPLPTSPDGTFSEKVLLAPGYNLITLEGQDRFGKRTAKNFALMLTETADNTFTLNTVPVAIN